jgi:hypothetical protein
MGYQDTNNHTKIGNISEPDMAMIDHYKNHIHFGFRYFTDIFMIII